MSEGLKTCPEGADVCCIEVKKVIRAATMKFVGYRAVCDECLEIGPTCQSEREAITGWNACVGETV